MTSAPPTASTTAPTTGADPILVEVIKNELAAIGEEIASAVSRTGRSQMVKIGDFAGVIFDGEGRLIGQGKAAPFQLPLFIEVMRHVQEKWHGQFEPGDVVITNDPYKGMGHMPDVAVCAPCFWRDQLVAYILVYSHHTDIGGRFAGGFSSQCRSIYEEGVRLSLLKLYERGERNESLMELILANVRAPEEWAGDLEAKVTGCWRGEREVQAMLDRHGRAAYDDCCNHLMDYAERSLRAALREVPDGHYVHESVFEDEAFGEDGILIRADVQVAGDEVVVDFTGTSPQVDLALNLPFGMATGVAQGALRILVPPDVLVNDGFVRPTRVHAPPGCLVNPQPPAAVGGRAPLAFCVADVVFRALAKALPDRVPVVGEGADVIHFSGTASSGDQFIGMDAFYGGWGGRPEHDGIDGVAPIQFGASGTRPVELLEREYPIMIDGFGYLPDTGGPGRHRGAVSVYREWRFLEPTHLMVRTNRLNASEGLLGGHPGALSYSVLNPGPDEQELPRATHVHLELSPDDRIYHVICGSGGHGDPLLRDPADVVEDVRQGKVTVEGALAGYGVVLDEETLEVDDAATRAARAARVDAGG